MPFARPNWRQRRNIHTHTIGHRSSLRGMRIKTRVMVSVKLDIDKYNKCECKKIVSFGISIVLDLFCVDIGAPFC